MDLKTIFRRLGFGSHAYKIYEALLHSKKPLLVAHLAKKVGASRIEMYRNLTKLLEKKFVAKVTEGKRTLYEAQSPERIYEEFSKASKKVFQISERLLTQKEKLLPKHIRYFKNFAGIRGVFDDVILHTPKGETFYRYTSEKNLEMVNRYLSPTYRAQRDKKKLERLVISNPLSGKQKRSRLERFIKYIPPEIDVFDQNIIQLIYGNRIGFINLNTEEAFIIEDAALANFQKVIFRQFYNRL